MTDKDRDQTADDRLSQQSHKDTEGEDPAEPREPGRSSNTAKDTNVVRGDDRPQSVRHSLLGYQGPAGLESSRFAITIRNGFQHDVVPADHCVFP
ncbi:MAG TPA: hypothetical protein VGL00_09005 [Terracidiphilus sp.]|jgi:hypothetical protein